MMYTDSGNTTRADDITSTKEMTKSLEESDSGVDPKINNELITRRLATWVRVWDYSFQKILWKHMVGRYGERIMRMDKELPL